MPVPPKFLVVTRGWGFHSSECSNCGLFYCDTLYSCMWLQIYL